MDSEKRALVIGSVFFGAAFVFIVFIAFIYPEYIAPAPETAGRRLKSAVQSGNVTFAKWYLSKGADANVIYPSEEKRCLLAYALEENRPELVRLLVEKGANVNAPCFSDGSTPLALAIQFRTQDNLEELLKLGADVKIADSIGRQPIHIAAISNNRPALQAIVKAGVGIDTPMNPPTDFANHVETESEREDRAAKGSPAYWLNQPTSIDGIMAKQAKKHRERQEIASMREQARLTPLMFAAINGDVALGEFLIDELKANPAFRAAGALTVREVAVESEQTAFVEMLDRKQKRQAE